MLPDALQAQLQDVIYGAVIEPARWKDVLETLAGVLSAEAGSLSRLSVVDGSGIAITTSDDSAVLKSYTSYYAAINPIVRVADPMGYAHDWRPKIMIDEETLARETLERTEYYNDFLRPISAEWGLHIRLGLNGNDLTVIDLGRSYGAGRFEAADLALARWIHPHLLRAHALSCRFASLHGLGLALAARLDQSVDAMILLDHEGRVLYCNAAAERMLSAADRLQIMAGRLTAIDQRSAGKLAAIITAAGENEWNDRKGCSVTLRLRDGMSSLVSVAPLRAQDMAVFADNAPILVTVTNGTSQRVLSPDLLTEIFGLTPAEARLAQALFKGLKLAVAASLYEISVNTARAQLSSIFAKTGTHRQVDLVRALEIAQSSD